MTKLILSGILLTNIVPVGNSFEAKINDTVDTASRDYEAITSSEIISTPKDSTSSSDNKNSSDHDLTIADETETSKENGVESNSGNVSSLEENNQEDAYLSTSNFSMNDPSFSLITESDFPTLIDETGTEFTGNELKEYENMIILQYQGTDMLKDTTVNGQPLKNGGTYRDGDIVKVKNAGNTSASDENIVAVFELEKNGIPVQIKIENKNTISFAISKTGIAARAIDVRVKVGYETIKGEPIKDENTGVAVATEIYGPYASSSQENYSNGTWKFSTLDNVIFKENEIYDMRNSAIERIGYKEDASSAYRHQIMTNYKVEANMTTISNTSEDLHAEFSYRNSQISSNTSATMAIKFLNPSVPLAITKKYSPPVVELTENTDGNLMMDMSIRQSLPGQNYPVNVPEYLDIKLNYSDISEFIGEFRNLSIVSDKKGDIISEIAVTNDSSNSEMTFRLPKELLIELGADILRITGQTQVRDDVEHLADFYGKNLEYPEMFALPLVAYNNSTGTRTTADNLVKMPSLKGTGILTEVDQNSSTNDLNPEELVTNLSSPLKFDVVNVVGFESPKTFDEVGMTEVTVVIESSATGKKEHVKVPINVIAGALEFKSVPDLLDFGSRKISTVNNIYRPSVSGNLIVSDTRGSKKGPWRVLLQETDKLSSKDSNLGGLTYYTNSNNETINIGEDKTIVEEGNLTDTNELNISENWKDKKGISLIIPVEKQIIGSYNGRLSWTLEDVPMD
ncbi:hypothetical protein [Enterococcus faecalis]|uniref:hypothetical protein n=1 Tax=Enterococcus faecalis TaxID=1351 RepID=UPI0004598864|nr:hypothetical protein [Enterococcus faecalis]KAJ61006.1 hypothetical protein P785_1780 [Enterococcus faecalis KS19]